jgi:hypothetical protein
MATRSNIARKESAGLRDFVASGSRLRHSRMLFGGANLRRGNDRFQPWLARAAFSRSTDAMQQE